MSAPFLSDVQRHLANTSVGPSTARGMGPQGTIAAARKFLVELQLARFACESATQFERTLETTTRRFIRRLPRGARHWGSARKFLNIFLRNALYNRYRCEGYGLARIENWLELPLDRHVALGLRKEQEGSNLPHWDAVIHLTKQNSRIYQDFASRIAKRERIARVHLDLRYWRNQSLKLLHD